MADSYRGLTIRIGADTSKLSSALRAANGAISATANQARRLKQALAMDPGNTGAIAKQMSVAGTQSDAVARKLAVLRDAYSNVSKQVVETGDNAGKTFGEVAKDTADAEQQAEDLKQTYNALDADLASLYKRLSAISHNVGNGKEFKVTDGDTTDLRKILAEYEAIKKKRQELAALDNRTDEQDKMLKSLKRQIPIYGEIVEQVRPLKSEFLEVSKAYDNAKTVAGLRDTEVEIEKTRAQLVQLINASENLSESPIRLGIEGTLESVKSLATQTDEAKTKAELLGRQINFSPSGIIATVAQGRALGVQLSAAKGQAEALRSAISKYRGAGIDKVASQTKDAKKAAADAKAEYTEAAVRVKELRQGIADAVAVQERLAKEGKQDSDTYRQKGEDIKRMTSELETAVPAAEALREKLDTSNAVVEYKDLVTQLEAVKANIVEIGNQSGLGQVTSAALLLAEQVGQYAKQGMTQVIDSTVQLDEAYANMRKTVNGTEEEFKGLYDTAVEMSKVQPITADTLLNIEALGGQLGFAEEGLDRLQDFAEVVGGLDVATNMDWETAGTYMAQFFNVFQTNKDLVGNYGSAIVDLGNHFATTESDISQMSARIASAGTSIGMSEADVLGLAAALSSMGVKAEAGGSSISTIMTNIDKSVALGTKGIEEYSNKLNMSTAEFIDYLGTLDDDAFQKLATSFGKSASEFEEATLEAASSLEEWSKVAGYDTAEKFASAWSKDPIEALTNIFLGLDEAADSGGNLALMLDDLGITSIRQLDISRRLASNPQLMADAIDRANEAWRENTALTTEVEKRNESLSARFEILKNTITAMKTELGEGFSPIIDFAIDKMEGIVDKLSGMSDEAKTKVLAVGAALAGLVTVTPIIRGVGGAILSLGSAILSFIGTATINPMTLGLSAGLLGILAIYEKFIKPAREAKKASEDFNAALKVTRDTAENVGKSMSSGKSAVKSFGDVAKDEAMSVRELTDEIEDFNDRMSSIAKPVEESNALLGEYQTIIDQFAGKGRATADDMALLEWAVDGINEALGTNYTAQDILMDKYSDEEGEIDNLCSYIDKLIEKRQAQARADAAQELYTESLKEQMKAEQYLTRAQEEYNDAVEKRNEIRDAYQEAGWNESDSVKMANRAMASDYDIDMTEVEANLKAAEDAYVELGGAVEDYKNLMIDSAKETYDASEIMAKFAEGAFTDQEFAWGKALSDNNIELEKFADACEDAGISASDLQAIYDDQSVFFKDMVDESGGDLQRLMEIIKEYNETHPRAELEVDDATKSAQELESQIRKSTGNMAMDIKAFATEAMPQFGQALQDSGVNDITYWSNKLADAGVTVDDLADIGVENFARLAKGCNGDINKMIDKIVQFEGKKLTDKNVKVTAAGNVVDGTASLAVQNLIDFQNRLRDRTVTYKATVTTSGDLSSAAALAEKFRAAGGIRYHADGMILNRPTWIGNRDIAGEAGAEAIIPLTNRRYVQPFADTVADGMLSKIGELGGTNVTIQLNYDAGADANQMVRDIANGIRAANLRAGRR